MKKTKSNTVNNFTYDESEHTLTFYDYSSIPPLTKEEEAMMKKKFDEILRKFGLR